MISVSEVFVKIWLKSVGQILRSKTEKKDKPQQNIRSSATRDLIMNNINAQSVSLRSLVAAESTAVEDECRSVITSIGAATARVARVRILPTFENPTVASI